MYAIHRNIRFVNNSIPNPTNKRRKHGMLIKRGLTLEEARAHCGMNSTHGDFRCGTDNQPVPHEAGFCPRCGGFTYANWFDGYDEE